LVEVRTPSENAPFCLTPDLSFPHHKA